jgi:small subunit ribosomal protein S10
MKEAKIRLALYSFDCSLLESASKQITKGVIGGGGKVSGPIPLPVKKRRFCLMKSTFVDKDSREHFEHKTYKHIIDIYQLTPKVLDMLMHLNISAGIEVEIKV